jgi:hypothetical protein
MGGLSNRETKEQITRDPDTIAKTIFGKAATADDLHNISAITKKLIDLYGPEQAKEIVKDAEATTGKALI